VVEQGVEVPPPVARERRQDLTPGDRHLPQVLRRPDSAGLAAAHADDGQRQVLGLAHDLLHIP
jgi:hypothetical protein